MNKRKIRIPLQGFANLRRAGSDWNRQCAYKSQENSTDAVDLTLACKPKTKTEPFTNDEHAASLKKLRCNLKAQPSSFLKDKEKIDQGKRQNMRIFKQIKKEFKNKPNIWRIAKAWKFTEKGFIHVDQFQQKIEEKIGVKLTEQQKSKLSQKFKESEGKIDIKSFLTIIYGEPSNLLYDPILFDVKKENKDRLVKIDNLIDKLQAFGPKRNHKIHHQSEVNISRGSNLVDISQKLFKSQLGDSTNSNIDNSKGICQRRNKSQLLRVDQGELPRQFTKDTFFNLPKSYYDKLKKNVNVKESEMHPETMMGKDQSKTRFGASPQHWQSIFPRQKLSKMERLQKKQVSQDDRELKKLKMQERIQKIRKISSIQKENINNIEKKEMQKQAGSLLRKKLDRQAYQYANFVKNKWL